MTPPAPPRIITIIPALNEEASIGRVIADLPEMIALVIVGNNGSTDRTADVAREHGALVVDQPERGYGAACLAALDEARKHEPDIVLFIDGDYSDDPTEAVDVLQPILDGTADMVIGSRTTGQSERGSLTPPQRFGKPPKNVPKPPRVCFQPSSIFCHKFLSRSHLNVSYKSAIIYWT